MQVAQAGLHDANIALEVVKQRVEQLAAALGALEVQLTESMEEKALAEAEMEQYTGKLDLAQRVVRSLASEQVRCETKLDAHL